MSATALEGFLPQLGELTPRVAECWTRGSRKKYLTNWNCCWPTRRFFLHPRQKATCFIHLQGHLSA